MSEGAEVVFAFLLALLAVSSCRTCVHVDRIATELERRSEAPRAEDAGVAAPRRH